MNKIQVLYWVSDWSVKTGLKHKTWFDYSEEKRNEIINIVLENNLAIMLKVYTDTLFMFIDDQKFGQR